MGLNKISIIIPTKDREVILNKTLRSLCDAFKEYEDHEILIINDSKTYEVRIPENLSDKISVLKNPKGGVASARNLGAEKASGEWLLFLDDDMLLSEKDLKCYLSYTDLHEKFCVNIEWTYPPEVIHLLEKKAFGRFLIKYGFTSMRGWNNFPDWKPNSRIQVKSIASANLFLRESHFIATKGYDENFPFAGFEDYAFSERLKSTDFKMYVDTSSLMFHNEADRLEPKSWYLRKKRGGETQKIAVQQGFGEVEIKYSFLKKIFYKSHIILKPIIHFVLLVTSPFKLLDTISFRCYKTLLGIAIFEGYRK